MSTKRIVMHVTGVTLSGGKYVPLEIGFFNLTNSESGSIGINISDPKLMAQINPQHVQLCRKRLGQEKERDSSLVQGDIDEALLEHFFACMYSGVEVLVYGKRQKQFFEKYFPTVRDLESCGMESVEELFRRWRQCQPEKMVFFRRLTARAKGWLIGQCARNVYDF